MGYVCPVCEDPQADGHHLANHLAFTAMLGDDDHEAWLDDTVPDWADTDPDELAPRVTDHAESGEFPQLFEDTTDGTGHTHDHGQSPVDGLDGVAPADPSALEGGREETADVIAEARELTRRRRENAAGEDESETESGQ
ncbi:hypothetical protein BRC64_12845 [Halobacteriales archaeon QH_10_67_22]|nr:MAG: hypothetical protein BRC64_12845 [Halobacteriales archaeon QH_10_67_22]